MIDYVFTYADLEYFLLVFVRISCCIFIVPFFSMNSTPRQVRVGLSFFISLLLFSTLKPYDPLQYNTVLGYAIIVMKEAVTGFLIGFGINICATVVNFAGTVVDMETGLSMATLLDPATNQSTSLTGVFYQYVIMLMLILSGMYSYIIKALAETFTLIPVNGTTFATDKLLNAMLKFMGDYITIGFRICLPVFAVILLLNAILGILAKVSPQLNMFAVGIQLKVLVGLAVLFLTVGMLPGAADFIFTETKKLVVGFVEGMM